MRRHPPLRAALSALSAAFATLWLAGGLAAAPGDVLQQVLSPCRGGVDIARDPRDGSYWLASITEYFVCRVQPDLAAEMDRLPLPFDNPINSFATGIAFNAAEETLFILDGLGGNVHEILLDGRPTGRVVPILHGLDLGPHPTDGLAFDPSGDGGQGSFYTVARSRALIIEIGADGRRLRSFPDPDDPSRFFGDGRPASLSDVEPIFEGGRLAGFFALGNFDSKPAVLRLDAEGRWTGWSLSLERAGQVDGGILAGEFRDPSSGALREGFLCTALASRFAVIEGGTPAFKALRNLRCSQAGSQVTIEWSRDQVYDRIEVLDDCALVAVLAGDADSWTGPIEGDGIHRLRARAAAGGQRGVTGECRVALGPGQVLKSLAIDGAEPGYGGDLAVVDGSTLVVVLTTEGRLRFFDLELQPLGEASISAFFAGPNDSLYGVAAGNEPRTVYLHNATTRSIGKVDFEGAFIDSIELGPLEHQLFSMEFRPQGHLGRGTWLFLGITGAPRRTSIFEFSLSGALLASWEHPYSTLAGVPPDCDFLVSGSGISLPFGGDGEVLLRSRKPGPELPEGIEADGRATDWRILRMELAGGGIAAGSELAVLPGLWYAHQHVVVDGQARLIGLGNVGRQVVLEALAASAPAVPPPARLSCRTTPDGRDVELRFASQGPYDSIEVHRDCERIAVLEGAATTYLDLAPPPGSKEYSVRGIRGGNASAFERSKVRTGAGALLRQASACGFDGATQFARNPADGSFYYASTSFASPHRVIHFDKDYRLQREFDVALNALSGRLWSIEIRIARDGERQLFYLHGSATRQVLASETLDGILLDTYDIEVVGPNPRGLAWDPASDTFFYQVLFTDTFVQIGTDGRTLRTFPHPRPPASFYVEDSGLCVWPERGTLLVTGVEGAEEASTRALEMAFDGRLTGYEIPLPFGPSVDSGVKDLAASGGTIYASGYIGGDFKFLELVAIDSTGQPQATFIRGDANGDRKLDLSDPVSVLNHLFLGGPAPPCTDAADGNDDGRLNLADAVYVLAHLFLGGPDPTAPFPEPGDDPTPDLLPCAPRAP
jgi:hypothetical protein